MFFASDNGAGASTKVLQAVMEAMSGPPMIAYGADEHTRRVERLFNEVFEREVAVFLTTSGTASNSLALAHVTPPWGAIYAHELAHANASECGAPTFYSGARLVGLPGTGGKLSPQAIEARIAATRLGDPHHCQPATITLTNLSECGTLYTPAEVAEIAGVAKRHGLALHMDGARLANALAASGASLADMTWRAGVDVLSFGATKGGAIAAEAVVFFEPKRAEGFLYRRMRGGHLLSKMRFIAAQFAAWLDEGHYLDLARHANAMASRLADGLGTMGMAPGWPVQGNEVFAIMPKPLAAYLNGLGIKFHAWSPASLPPGVALKADQQLSRLICSFATSLEEVDELIALIRASNVPARAAE